MSEGERGKEEGKEREREGGGERAGIGKRNCKTVPGIHVLWVCVCLPPIATSVACRQHCNIPTSIYGEGGS